MTVTLGEQGVLYAGPGEPIHQPAIHADVVDTTAAGDTFIGYYLARRAQGRPVQDSLAWACCAASICVTRCGAMDSIPQAADVMG